MKRFPSLPVLLLAVVFLLPAFAAKAGSLPGKKANNGFHGGDDITTRIESETTHGASPTTTDFDLTASLPALVHDGQEFAVIVDALKTGASRVEVRTQNGRLVREVSVTLDKGTNYLSIHLGDLEAGLYFFNIISGSKSEVRVFEVR